MSGVVGFDTASTRLLTYASVKQRLAIPDRT